MRRQPKAFTLVELLVVVAIIGLLLAILLPSLNMATDIAHQTRGMSNLKQMLQGYTYYSMENRGNLLYGYAPNNVNGTTLSATYQGQTFNGIVVNRYPWRLAPYVEDAFRVFYSNSEAPDAPQASDPPGEAFSKAYTLSVSPTFGINSVFVGGHYGVFYKGFNLQGSTHVPNNGKHVVFRDTHVKNPSGLIGFTETQMTGGGATEYTGLHWTTPPNADVEMWQTDASDDRAFEVLNTSRVIGLPKGHFRKQTITGFLDTHVERLNARELDNMTLWANEADSTDDYMIP